MLGHSETAPAKAGSRLLDDAPVKRVTGNVLHWRPSWYFDVWHDRAAFHVRTDTSDLGVYLQIMNPDLLSDGYVIIGTVAHTGPDKCSRVPVERYDAALQSARLGKVYHLFKSWTHVHTAPWGRVHGVHFGLLRKA